MTRCLTKEVCSLFKRKKRGRKSTSATNFCSNISIIIIIFFFSLHAQTLVFAFLNTCVVCAFSLLYLGEVVFVFSIEKYG